jgi:cytoskeletal protein CcmA (bactofilin family)
MFGRDNRNKELSVLAMSCDFVGNLTYSGTLEILGRVEGDIAVNGKVIVGPSGSCIGNIRADVVEVLGEVQGKVESEVLKLTAGGRLVGDAIYSNIVMDEGSVFMRLVPDEDEHRSSLDPEIQLDTVSQTDEADQSKDDEGKEFCLSQDSEIEPKEPKSPKDVPEKKPRFETVF